MPITIERLKHRVDVAGYEPFVAALETAYNLTEIGAGDLNWVDVKPISFTTPQVRVHITDDHPELSIILRPENSEDQQIMGEHEQYQTPLLLTKVDRWGSENLELKEYKVDRWEGRPGPETMFSEPRSLAEIIALGHSDSIKDSTPVVEVVSFLPMAPTGEFQTQFVPYISFDTLGHRYYKVVTIAENALSAYVVLTQGQAGKIQDIDENRTTYNWMADSFPGLTDFEKMASPSSHGHMILIATPVEDPTPKFDIDDLLGRDRSYGFGGGDMKGFGGGSLMMGGPMRGGASISSASIGRGSASGKGDLYDGEVRDSKKGHPIIYHIHYLCVTPTEAKSINSDALGRLGIGMQNFGRN